MKRSYFISMACLCLGLVFLGGCGKSELIQDVNSVAILTVQFNRDMPKVDKNGNENKSISLTSIAAKAAGSRLMGITEEEQAFFDDMTATVEGLIKGYGITVISDQKLASNAAFSALPKYEPSAIKQFGTKLKELTFYIPEPYKQINLAPHLGGKKTKEKGGKDLAIRLCQELGVDAVATFQFQFVKIQERKALVMAAERLGAKGYFIMRNAQGDIIYNKTIFAEAEDSQLKFELIDGFSYTLNSAKSFDQVRDAFIAKLDKALIKGFNKEKK